MVQTRKQAKLPASRPERRLNALFRRLRRAPVVNRAVGIAFLILGIMLIALGMNATDSVESDFSRFFSGTPISKAVGFLVSGIVSVIVGGMISLRPQRR